MIPEPFIDVVDNILVVRDDLLPGGTKRRAIHCLFDHRDEYVYPGPVFGYAQLALAHAAADHGKRATIFCAARKTRHELTEKVIAAGAKVVEVPHGYLSVVKARAREYCEETGAKLLPWGLDTPAFVDELAQVARDISLAPLEIWTVAGSGVLTRALQQAWPRADFHAIRIGAEANVGRAKIYEAPEKYEHPARRPPPFPSCTNYDAKAWQFVRVHARRDGRALFWNVGS